ncbi:hypothetical protein [Sphingomonas aerophila]|uniref:Uncharacterized protein n=1 Tax=Sphingomonas aerophila TaxID=1344948 RepID=A0A7W9BG24_9SPHN|nr:hypothetical protein [Sphingomonas aerophila]MBB5716249.1 hypothetical protein [Sphingomonas aerophila]
MDKGEDGQEPSPAEWRRRRIARHLKEGRGLEVELAVFATLPADKQRIVDDRLAIIDALPGGDERTMEHVEQAARALGRGVRNLYRLIDRMKEVGPVGGLAPGFRASKREAPVRKGLGEPIEKWIAEKLRRKPDASVAEIADYLSRRFDKHTRTRSTGSAETFAEFDLPSSSSLYRRVHAIRSGEAELRTRTRKIPFGGRMVLDQVALNVTVGTVFGRSNDVVATLLVDRATSLIVGVGLAVENSMGMGLQGAVADAIRRRLAKIGDSGVVLAETLSRVEWVVPPGLEDVADAVLEGAAKLQPPPEIVIRSAGRRRHGSEVVRLLGDRLGQFAFRVRSTGSRPLSEEASKYADGEPALTRRALLGVEDVLPALRLAADEANAARLMKLAKAGDDAEIRQARIEQLALALRTLFEPVLLRIEEQFDRGLEDYRRPVRVFF